MLERTLRREQLYAFNDIGLANSIRPDENGQVGYAIQVQRLIITEIRERDMFYAQAHSTNSDVTKRERA